MVRVLEIVAVLVIAVVSEMVVVEYLGLVVLCMLLASLQAVVAFVQHCHGLAMPQLCYAQFVSC